MKYRVSQFSAESPEMGHREFAEFVADIRRNGQLVPIWVRGDEVIDGRKRLAACEKLGISPKVVNLSPDQDARAIARALNALRTHYTPSQRAVYAAEQANAKSGARTDLETSSTNGGGSVVVTVEQAAKEAGVSPAYVSLARKVIREAPAATVQAIKAGKVSVKRAAQALDIAQGKRHAPNGDARRGRFAPKVSAIQRYIDTAARMAVSADYLAQFLPDVMGQPEADAVLARLAGIRTQLSRIIDRLKREVA